MSKASPIENKPGPIAWMAGHSVAASLIMIFCLVGGYMSMRNIKQEVFPDLSPDTVTVTVAYPGASPEEVEDGILLVIEEAIRGLDDVDEISSTASEGLGRVVVEARLGADLQQLAQDIQSEVDRVRTFPDDAEEPEISVDSISREVLKVVIAGNVSDQVLHQLGEQARDELLQDKEITQIELAGLPPLEISIEISQEELRRYSLGFNEVATRLREASIDMPGGGMKTKGGEVLIRVKEKRDYGSQFAQLPIITTPDGSEVVLEDIATIEDSFADSDRFTRFDGSPAVILKVFRTGNETPTSVSDAVQERIKEINRILPPGVSVEILDDRSDIYRQRVQLLLKNGAMGLALVLIVLGLFLEARLAFWVMMGIPISFLGSFLLLPSMDVTINMVSLFAYIVALGIVVDDAIVVGENVYHYHQEGMPFRKAAIKGARDVAMPVTFSILTNIVAFLPIYFIPGMMGKIFKMIPIVVTVVFLISLGESLFILPSHLSHQRDRKRRGIFAWLHNRQQSFSHAFTRWVRNRFGPFLELTLHHRYITIIIAACLLVTSLAYAISGRMGFQMFPVVESDYAQATVVLPYGTPVENTEKVMERIMAGARAVVEKDGRSELVTSITAEIGQSGGHTGLMRVQLADPEIRTKIMSTQEFTDRWRKVVGEIEGVESLRFASDSGGPGGRGQPVTVELSHRDISVLEKASRELADQIETYPITTDVEDGFQPGKQQLDFTLKAEGKSLGLTAAGLARQVRGAFYGIEVLRQQRGRNEIKIMVRLPERVRESEQAIYDMMILTPAGTYVPLRQVATMSRGRAYTTIGRRNGRRIVQVSAGAEPRSKAGEVLSDLKANVLPGLLEKYPGLTYSFEGQQADISESMGSLKVTFVLALMAIFAMLAIPFQSFTQPLIVMISIPFGIVGAVIGHLIMGYNLSILSMFGIVALTGVVINDSLVLVDYANRRRRNDGLNHHDAIKSAGIQRFRPVILTTLTTFGGLAPMIFETSRQARFLIPMALSLGFGILFATSITLVLVPALYLSIEDCSISARRIKTFFQHDSENQ